MTPARPIFTKQYSQRVLVGRSSWESADRSWPRAVTWYTAPGYSSRNGLAMPSTVYYRPPMKMRIATGATY
jgi:hypothetical protein